jgi:glutamate/tyrosine decarboxylase-like PLP-dependent enzyme
VIGAPFQTSVFLTRHKVMDVEYQPIIYLIQALMYDCHSCKAKYLFNPIKYYDTTFDSGDASLQCGRRADVLKVYVMMRARGCANIANLLDRTVESAMCFADAISNNAHFRFVIENGPKVTITPPTISRVNWVLLVYTGARHKCLLLAYTENNENAMIACQPVDEKQLADFFRITFCCHPLNSTQDIYELVAILEQLVDSLE